MKLCIRQGIKDMTRDFVRFLPILCLILFVLGVMEWLFDSVCPLAIVTGFPCPGCGMTRALVLFLQLRFAESFQMNPLLILVIVGVAGHIVLKYFLKKDSHYINNYVIIALAISIGFYIYRMAAYFPDQEPMVFREDNLIRSILNLYRTLRGK